MPPTHDQQCKIKQQIMTEFAKEADKNAVMFETYAGKS